LGLRSGKSGLRHDHARVSGQRGIAPVRAWFGVIRPQVDGNSISKAIKDDDPDGNQVVHDTIGGTSSAEDVAGAPQFGDAIEDRARGGWLLR
jgi:hypothetical protein